jgi:hypothetical protein
MWPFVTENWKDFGLETEFKSKFLLDSPQHLQNYLASEKGRLQLTLKFTVKKNFFSSF